MGTDIMHGMGRKLAVAASVFLLAQCMRGGFDVAQDSGRAGFDVAQESGGGFDVAQDDGAAVDAPPSPLRGLVCAAPTEIPWPPGETARVSNPSLSKDGLGLLVEGSGDTWYRAARVDTSQPFGDWQDLNWVYGIVDAALFSTPSGVEHVLAAVHPGGGATGPRHLIHCTALPPTSSQCEQLSLTFVKAPSILDFDGPDLIEDSGSPLLVFNGNDEIGWGIGIFVARSKDPSGPRPFAAWNATELSGLTLDGAVGIGDPAISQDGKVLVYERLHDQAAQDWNLWAAYRVPGTDTFSNPEPLATLNTAEREQAPTVHWDASVGYEVIFTRDRNKAAYRLLRSTCTPKP